MTAELLTVQEVAKFCKVHEATIRREIASGKLLSVRVGRSVRVRKEDLEVYLALKIVPRNGTASGEVEHRPFTMEDPFWKIVGMIDDDGPDWVSSDKRRALAEAYATKP